jgi:heme O synthase-like polyprenyltransferase
MNWGSCQNGGVATLSCIPLLIANLIYWGLMLASSVAVFLIILGGISFIMSSGDPKKIEGARKTIGYSILGLFVIFLSFYIVNLIGVVTGVACINTSNPFTLTSCM